jgi:hypothetical protein
MGGNVLHMAMVLCRALTWSLLVLTQSVNDSDENQTLEDSFMEGPPSPMPQDESTLTNQDEEFADLMQVIQADFHQDVTEPPRMEQRLRCNVYVSSQIDGTIPTNVPKETGKGRVRFRFDQGNQQNPVPSIGTQNTTSTPRTPFKLKSILCNGSEAIPTTGCVSTPGCVSFEGTKQYETKVEETTTALSSAMEQLTFGDDVMDVFERSQEDMSHMMNQITAETEKSMESCRSLSRKLSGASDEMIQKVSAETKSLSDNLAGSVQQSSSDVNKLEEVVADHWKKGHFNTEQKATTTDGQSDDATPSPMTNSTPISIQEQQCDPSKHWMEFLNTVSNIMTEATKAVQYTANSCDEPQRPHSDDLLQEYHHTLSETPLDHSWFSVDHDTDSISKLSNPHDLSNTLNNISLDLTAIPKVEEKEF